MSHVLTKMIASFLKVYAVISAQKSVNNLKWWHQHWDPHVPRFQIVSVQFFSCFLQNECNPMDILPSWYWCVVLALAVIVLSSIVIVYMKILSVARQQIRSIELLVLQVHSTAIIN